MLFFPGSSPRRMQHITHNLPRSLLLPSWNLTQKHLVRYQQAPPSFALLNPGLVARITSQKAYRHPWTNSLRQAGSTHSINTKVGCRNYAALSTPGKLRDLNHVSPFVSRQGEGLATASPAGLLSTCPRALITSSLQISPLTVRILPWRSRTWAL